MHYHCAKNRQHDEGRNYNPADSAMRGGAKGQGDLCHWEKEILELGPNKSPGRGPIWCFFAVGTECEITPLALTL